jgi:hypothetical protein
VTFLTIFGFTSCCSSLSEVGSSTFFSSTFFSSTFFFDTTFVVLDSLPTETRFDLDDILIININKTLIC